MLDTYKILLVILSIGLITGCQQKSLMPGEVAQEYWNAVKSGNTEQLRNLSIDAANAATDPEISELKLKDFKIKRIIIEDKDAVVEVDLQLAEADSIPVPVNTILVKQNQTWLVDHATTFASLKTKSDLGNAIAALHQFSRILSRDLDQSLTELEKKAPVIRKDINNLIDKMSTRLPTLKREFQQLLEDIDQSVKSFAEKSQSQDIKPKMKRKQSPQLNPEVL
ncbi:MAG: hypothetical protein K0U68_15160 [Gammaproteobacteria bacterium]|nr:hypothetical protein [Gammaproteobacteria bacterium]